jgi:hypothetical protein
MAPLLTHTADLRVKQKARLRFDVARSEMLAAFREMVRASPDDETLADEADGTANALRQLLALNL